MKRRLLDILACPIDKHYPLDLIELVSEGDVIKEGVLLCSKCSRFYPIIDEIPVMLPDDLRNKDEDISFLRKWMNTLPETLLYGAKPFHLEKG
ncbi:MAG: Trm112 family protein [Nitrososphaerales archaeon]